MSGPVAFAVKGLPRGLTLGASTGNVTGSTTERGTHAVEFTATDTRGNDKDARPRRLGRGLYEASF